MSPDLPLFARVVAAGSLSAAGRSLGISPAMVSKRIARLEARLGARLLHRTTRRLELTVDGERFHRDVLAILDAMQVAEARFGDRAAAPAGPLRVSAPTSFGRLHLAPCLKPFLDRHPQVELELNLSDEFGDLLRDGIDLAVRITSTVSPTLVAHRLAGSRRVLCAAPAYRLDHGLPADVAALAGHRLLAATGQLPWRLSGPAGNIAVDGDSHVRTNSSEVVRELAVAGVGIALRSLWDVGRELRSGALVRVLPDVEGSSDAGIHAVHPRGTPPPAVAALIGHLRAAWSPVPPWEQDAAT